MKKFRKKMTSEEKQHFTTTAFRAFNRSVAATLIFSFFLGFTAPAFAVSSAPPPRVPPTGDRDIAPLYVGGMVGAGVGLPLDLHVSIPGIVGGALRREIASEAIESQAKVYPDLFNSRSNGNSTPKDESTFGAGVYADAVGAATGSKATDIGELLARGISLSGPTILNASRLLERIHLSDIRLPAVVEARFGGTIIRLADKVENASYNFTTKVAPGLKSAATKIGYIGVGLDTTQLVAALASKDPGRIKTAIAGTLVSDFNSIGVSDLYLPGSYTSILLPVGLKAAGVATATVGTVGSALLLAPITYAVVTHVERRALKITNENFGGGGLSAYDVLESIGDDLGDEYLASADGLEALLFGANTDLRDRQDNAKFQAAVKESQLKYRERLAAYNRVILEVTHAVMDDQALTLGKPSDKPFVLTGLNTARSLTSDPRIEANFNKIQQESMAYVRQTATAPLTPAVAAQAGGYFSQNLVLAQEAQANLAGLKTTENSIFTHDFGKQTLVVSPPAFSGAFNNGGIAYESNGVTLSEVAENSAFTFPTKSFINAGLGIGSQPARNAAAQFNLLKGTGGLAGSKETTAQAAAAAAAAAKAAALARAAAARAAAARAEAEAQAQAQAAAEARVQAEMQDAAASRMNSYFYGSGSSDVGFYGSGSGSGGDWNSFGSSNSSFDALARSINEANDFDPFGGRDPYAPYEYNPVQDLDFYSSSGGGGSTSGYDTSYIDNLYRNESSSGSFSETNGYGPILDNGDGSSFAAIKEPSAEGYGSAASVYGLGDGVFDTSGTGVYETGAGIVIDGVGDGGGSDDGYSLVIDGVGDGGGDSGGGFESGD